MEKEKLERCGFCGNYFRGVEYLTDDELAKIDKKTLDTAPLGYCPNANNEEQYQE